jgi:hypothetical protein
MVGSCREVCFWNDIYIYIYVCRKTCFSQHSHFVLICLFVSLRLLQQRQVRWVPDAARLRGDGLQVESRRERQVWRQLGYPSPSPCGYKYNNTV